MIVSESTIEIVIRGVVNKTEATVAVILVVLINHSTADIEISRPQDGVITKGTRASTYRYLLQRSPSAILKPAGVGRNTCYQSIGTGHSSKPTNTIIPVINGCVRCIGNLLQLTGQIVIIG